MKKAIFLSLFGFLLGSCDHKEAQSPLTGQETVSSLNELARQMAANNSWITPDLLLQLERSSVGINEIGRLKNKLHAGLTKLSANGFEYEASLELEQRSFESGLAKSYHTGSAYRIALDPDQFYFPKGIMEEDLRDMPEIELPTYVFDNNSTEPREETVILGPNTVFNEPLFYLVMKETADEPSGLGKALATPGIYITFISANLRKKNDSGNEEFEVGYSDGPNVTYDAFNATSALRFDGVSRLDAAGVTRLFPDINTATLYTAQQPIAMRKLDGIGAPSAWRLIATEDDAAVGEFYRYSGEFNGYKPADYYDMADDYLKLNLNSKFNFHDFGSGSFDLDDIYTKTGIMNINEDNVSDRLGLYLFKDTDNNLSGIPLGDINWRFGMVTY